MQVLLDASLCDVLDNVRDDVHFLSLVHSILIHVVHPILDLL